MGEVKKESAALKVKTQVTSTKLINLSKAPLVLQTTALQYNSTIYFEFTHNIESWEIPTYDFSVPKLNKL